MPDKAATGPFGRGRWVLSEPRALTEINSSASDANMWLLADRRTLYFSSSVSGSEDIYQTTRTEPGAPFTTPAAVVALNSAQNDSIAVSADGLTAFLATSRKGGSTGLVDIWVGKRSSASVPWSISLFAPEPVLNTADDEWDPNPSADGQRLYYAINNFAGGVGKQELVLAKRNSSGSFGPPQAISGVNSSVDDGDPTLSPDERVLVFASFRPGGTGGLDLWYAVRSNLDAAFSTPQPLSALNTSYEDGEAFISSDGTELFFSSNRPGGKGSHDIYLVTILEGP